MSKIDRLKLPIWQEIMYLVLIALIPIIISACEIFHSSSTIFKITFSSIGCLLLTVIVIRKFVFAQKIMKIQEKCVLLEHDYAIDVGDKEKTKALWARYNIIILAYHSIVVLLATLLAYLFIDALSKQLIAFRGASLIILGSVIIGLILKIVFYGLLLKGKSEVTDVGETEQV